MTLNIARDTKKKKKLIPKESNFTTFVKFIISNLKINISKLIHLHHT